MRPTFVVTIVLSCVTLTLVAIAIAHQLAHARASTSPGPMREHTLPLRRYTASLLAELSLPSGQVSPSQWHESKDLKNATRELAFDCNIQSDTLLRRVRVLPPGGGFTDLPLPSSADVLVAVPLRSNREFAASVFSRPRGSGERSVALAMSERSSTMVLEFGRLRL